MFKKLIAIAISVLTVISSSSVMCFAAETDNEPDVAETLKSGDYEYTVYGDSATITRYTGSEKELVVPSELQGKTVVYIGFNAFANNKSITSVTIPESVSYISHGAFSGCTNLASIDLPEKPLQLRGSSFSDTAYYNNSENWTDGAFYIDKNLVYVDETAKGDFVVRKGTLYICDFSFEENDSITSQIL